MGIANLKKLIGSSGTKKHLSVYRGKRVAVDTSIWLYRFIYRDEENAVILGILRQLRQFHKHQIIPVYVFDGKASSDIKIEIERRQERRARVNNALDTLEVELAETLEELGDNEAAGLVIPDDYSDPVTGISGNIHVDVTNVLPFQANEVPQFLPDSDEEDYYVPPVVEIEEIESRQKKALRLQSRIQMLQKQTRRPTKEIVASCKELLTILGLPFVQSPGESDLMLSELIAKGQVDAVMSEDTDMLPYGCHTFITGFKDNDDNVIEFQLAKILTDFGLTREQFVDVCILCGCDYAEKIYKIGVKKGFDLIKKYGTIEAILQCIDSSPSLASRHPYPEDYLSGVNVARSMFLTRTPGVTEDEEIGRTTSEIHLDATDEETKPFTWSFIDADSKEVEIVRKTQYSQFLQRNSVLCSDANMKLCQNWTGRSQSQKSMLDFFGKQ